MKKSKTQVDKKRHGLHHRHGKHYSRVYLPYLPAIIMFLAAFFISNLNFVGQSSTLAYATNMSRGGLLEATNSERAKAKRGLLELNDQLNAAAQAKAKDMATRDYWSHNTPSGEEPWIFIDNAGYRYLKAGENLAYGFLSSDGTVNGWMNSATHRANLLDANYTDVGFGFANAANFQKNGPETVVVAMYGKPRSPAPVAATQPAAEDKNAETEQQLQPELARGLTSTSKIAEANNPSLNIAKVQALTRGQAPWAMFVVGIISGMATVLLFANHGLRFRKLLREGETFISHHPVLDVTMVSILALSVALSQSVGVIK